LNSLTTFDSTKEALLDILRGISAGKTQLPDFQRGWVWDDEHIRSLLASISLSYPIGAVMMLQSGNADVKFKPRLVEGVSLVSVPEPERLILDGQQRLTSLYQALTAEVPVSTRDSRRNNIQRWYYLDIGKALDPLADREEAIVGLPVDRKLRNFRGEVIADYSTTELECRHGLFPLPLVFDTVGLTTWQMMYLQVEPGNIQQRLIQWNELVQGVIQRFQQYQVPVIFLRKETPKEAVCQVFEKVNTGGVSLTVFELLTATYAADDYNLRDDWSARDRQLQQYKVLGRTGSDDFLQAITLLSTRAHRLQAITEGVEPERAPGVACKRKDILRLTLADYRTWSGPAALGFEAAARLIQSQRIYSADDVPYRTQLTPLAAIIAVLGTRADSDSVRAKLARWYWCGVFGELYGSAVETRFARDLQEVPTWINGGAEPDTVSEANFLRSRLISLRTRNSAAYKGLYALLLRDGGLDFRTGEAIDLQMYFDDRIDIHHIFPQDWCKTRGIDPRRSDSVINKTAISARTNRVIGGNAPSAYLTRIESIAGISEDRMDEILQSHVIVPSALRADDFDAFFGAREQALLNRIEKAMGKPIAQETVPLVDAERTEYEDEQEIA